MSDFRPCLDRRKHDAQNVEALVWTFQEKTTVRPERHQKEEKKKKVDWGPGVTCG